MTITKIIPITDLEAGTLEAESVFLQRTNGTDYKNTVGDLDTYLNKSGKLRTALDEETAARKAADTTLQSNIDSEASTRASADSTLQSNINTEASARTAADSAEAAARESADDALQAAIDTLNGDATTEGSVEKTVTDKIAEVVADAPESLDTLKEISDWISSHEDSAAAMNTAIAGKLDKTTDAANAGSAVIVDEDGNLTFGEAGINEEAVKDIVLANAADGVYSTETATDDEGNETTTTTTIRDKLDSVAGKVVTLTAAEYEALEEKDEDTVYIVTGESEAAADALIDDDTASTQKTYSSSKIEERIESAVNSDFIDVSDSWSDSATRSSYITVNDAICRYRKIGSFVFVMAVLEITTTDALNELETGWFDDLPEPDDTDGFQDRFPLSMWKTGAYYACDNIIYRKTENNKFVFLTRTQDSMPAHTMYITYHGFYHTSE